MKKRRKQYSAGAIIWIIFKYVSLGSVPACEHGKGIREFRDRYGLCPDRSHHHRYTACVSVKPFPVPGQRADPQPVFIRGTASGCCHAGNGLPDHA